MSFETMYGGHAGRGFNLAGKFSSIENMVSNFKKGAEYTGIKYDEYCIISSDNLNDTDNGKLYKRTPNYTNSMGGAVYCGQIVGPQSGLPYMQLNTITEIVNQSTKSLAANVERSFPVGKTVNSDGTYTYIMNTDSGHENDDIATFDFSDAHNTSLIPGKDGSTYNDSILYTWCSIREPDKDKPCYYYVGLTIPYLVMEFETHVLSPYASSTAALDEDDTNSSSHPFYRKWDIGLPKGVKGDSLRNLRVMTPTSSSKIYKISSVQNLMDTSSGKVNLGSLSSSDYYDGLSDDVTNKRQILVADFYVFDKYFTSKGIPSTTAGQTTYASNTNYATVYIGDFNQISNITVDDEGTLTVYTTHDNPSGTSKWEKKINWIKSIDLNTSTGKLTVTGNNSNTSSSTNGTANYTTNLTWVKDVQVSTDGTIDIDSTTGSADHTYTKMMNWIKSISLDTSTGKFVVTGNNSNTSSSTYGTANYTTNLTWVKDVTFDDSDGSITVTSTTGSADHNYPDMITWITGVSLNTSTGAFKVTTNNSKADYATNLTWVKDIEVDKESGNITFVYTTGSDKTVKGLFEYYNAASVDDTGVITLYTNTGSSDTIKTQGTNGPTSTDYQLKAVKTIELSDDSDLDKDKHIFVTYNTSTAAEEIGGPINYISDMRVRKDDLHLLVLYTDPEHRPDSDLIDETTGMITDKSSKFYNQKWYKGGAFVDKDGNTVSTNYVWRDFGTIHDQAGVLIGKQILSTTVGETENHKITVSEEGDVLSWLDNEYPNGLTGDATKSKIVIYKPDGSTIREFYAFDYDAGSWFFLGTLSDDGMRDAKIINTSIEYNTDSVNTNGVVLKKITDSTLAYSKVTLESCTIPDYYSSTYTW